jgi:TolB protein
VATATAIVTATTQATALPKPSPTTLVGTPTRAGATAVANPTAPVPSPPKTPVPAAWKTFASGDYAVTLRYPPGWALDPRYTRPDQERYTGSDGFFQVSASGADSIDAAADHEANQLQHPYGSQPTISSLQVDGQEARLVLPSADQPGEMAGQAAVIVASPQPIRLASVSYPYLVLWADQGHVRAIVTTLRFTVANATARAADQVVVGPGWFD